MKAIKLLALAIFGLASTASAAPSVYERAPATIDLGAATNFESSVTVTVALKLRNTDEMQSLLAATYTAGSPQFHRFLTTDEFTARFGPAAETIERVMNHFRQAGLQVTRSTGTHLRITGTPAAIERAFNVSLHAFEVPAGTRLAAYRYHAPLNAASVAPAIGDAVQAIVGLDSRPHYRPRLRHFTPGAMHLPLVSVSGSGTINPPGALTVQDFAQVYNVNPLYHRGILGNGVTIGIVTLASFTASDAYAYWGALGLAFSPTRIKELQVDGGSGPPSDDSGSLETTIDVEQSGGLSPGSKILVYEAPNTNQAFVDAFAQAIFSNKADTISCSWGEWEWGDLLAQGGAVTDPTNGHSVAPIQALNDLFIQAALQGQSMYVAAGDNGAYDSTEFFGVPSWPVPPGAAVLSVDDPASQQWVTAAGGTTLPGVQTYGLGPSTTLSINVKTEQAWGWDYLTPLCTALGLDPVSCGIFSAGTGGGVSAYIPVPFYQWGIDGIQRTARGQSLLDYSQTPPAPVVTLPAGFPGRNVPDLSVNSDPQTGYAVYYTSSVSGYGIEDFWGGTSFAAPQFNGVTALFDSAMGHRVGLLNFALYQLARSGSAYSGHDAPLRDITTGDNWGYSAHRGYDQATGLGVPNVANLLRALQSDN